MSKVNRDLFYKLASELPEERVQAAVSIIKELSELELPDADTEWKYVLNRLITGLSSDRNGARLGFSLCLTEVVNLAIELSKDKKKSVPECLPNIEEFLNLLSKTLSLESDKSNKKRKGKEERGLLFGKLFGLQCLLNEPLFTSIFFENKSVSKFSTTFMNELLTLSQYKNWIREPCLFTLFQTITKLIPFANEEFIRSIIQLLDSYKLTLTNEGLAIYLSILYNDKKFNLTNITLENNGWKNNDPLTRGNLPLLTDVLRQSSVAEDENNNIKQANWTPRLHFVWKVLLPIICKAPDSNGEHINKKRKKEKEMIKFAEFWQMAVDESYFNEKSSSERKFLGFLIFEKTISLVDAHWIPSIFTQNFMRSLINQSTDSKRMLHKISQKTLNIIVNACGPEHEVKLVSCLKAILFGSNGSVNFDKLTKSKTVSKLITTPNLNENILEQLFTMLYAELPSKIDSDLSLVRFILDTTLHIVRSHKNGIPVTLAVTILKPIVLLAFFTNDNEQLNELARERLYSILAELTGVKTDTHSWQYYTLDIIVDLENDTDSKIELVNKLDDSLIRVKQDAMEVLSDISTSLESTDKETSKLRGMESLISMCLLQLYSGDVESVSVIEELCSFYNTQSEEGDNSMVGVTEILLSLLAQKKAMLRRISLAVWEQFISDIGRDELKVLLDVLSARENKQGFSQLFEGVDDYEEEEEEDAANDDDKKDDSDAEDDENKSSEEEDSSSESEDDIDNENVANIDKETSSALAKALNLPESIINENGEVKFDELDDFSGDEESDEESMDDEKMMELDDQLSEIFKRRKEALSSIPTGNQRKSDVKMSRENVISFKHRIVEMLEIYVKYIERCTVEKRKGESDTNVNGSNLLLFILPMITCVRETLDKSLSDKISKLLKTKVFKITVNVFSNVTDEECLTLIKQVHGKLLSSKPGHFSVNYYSLCSTSSIFLGKILLENNKGDSSSVILEELVDIYCQTTKKWMVKGKFGVNIFIDFYNWLSSKKR
ncbi:similar to Saccharomyces cerevisiae YEL055C POL5 DNA Polymerase phi [Maudiozyma saulgeensis]|uniref:Similar to Saccharomyces cerevisiae YEL055C POL5 DNA Polymerase phi n=1 Tax=Maudiozyma saulgeensis TaxID=1789683 RepID=A0A1X7RBB5_9SACH|nr:similar to Saccharomyces cerevisiae YEL055C POL5 DNA Polymerase phi [Kazachstania saulgeensis]